ncbi:MAG: metallophosphoesterase [Clostridia bacterium]|nr:metallophosphoesterase [Clostridia bacterium]
MGDLHLPGGQEKPMDVFGPQWEGHFQRISDSWEAQVKPEDTVLIPGDISWAMRLEDARKDLEKVGRLPGRKVLIRGNHDYWWGGITRVREMLPEGMYALQQDALDLGECVVCGTRGWLIPTDEAPLEPHEQKIYQREIARLEMAIQAARRIAGDRPVVVMIHYPPLLKNQRTSRFTELMEAADVRVCVYGHLHGAGILAGFQGEQGGTRYLLTSCDSLDFQVKKINFL